MQYTRILFYNLVIFILFGCSKQFISSVDKFNTVKSIILISNKFNNQLNRAISNQLIFNNIKLIEGEHKNENTLTLYILNSDIDKKTASLFQDGSVAEYNLILSIFARIQTSKNENYPINFRINYSFFRNQQTALIQDNEQQFIINEMYDRAATELVHRILDIGIIKK